MSNSPPPDTSQAPETMTAEEWKAFKPTCKWLEVPRVTQARVLPGFADDTPFVYPHKFTVMSYNILAQTLIRRELFPTSTKASLKWPKRSANIVEEIKLYAPDIMCLQEIDGFDKIYKPAFVEDPQGGFAGGHWTKKLGNKNDGCATFWRRGVFELEAYKDLNFNELTLKEPFYDGNETKCDRSELERGNMGQLVALRCVKSEGSEKDSPARGVIVFNAHFFWNPDYNYVRLAQGIAALQEMMKFKEEVAADWPVILCGDYNNSSGDPFYESFFERQNLSFVWANNPCWLTAPTHYSKWQAHVVKPSKEVLDAENAPPPQTIEQQQVRQTLVKHLLERLDLPEIVSSYKDYRLADPRADYSDQPSIYEPPFTSFGPWWRGPLDYISVWAAGQYHTTNDFCALVPLRFTALPTPSEMGPTVTPIKGQRPGVVSFPNDVRGSDHLPLQVEFGICPRFINNRPDHQA